MTTGSTLAQLQASTWQLQGASSDTFTWVAGDKAAGKNGATTATLAASQEQDDGVLTLPAPWVRRA